MPPVNPELIGKAISSADKAKKGVDAAQKAGSSGGKGSPNLPQINRQPSVANAQNFLRGSENSAEKGDDESSNSRVNYTGSGRSRTSNSSSRFFQKGKQGGKLNVKNLKKAAPVIVGLGFILLPMLLIFGAGSLLFADIDENTQDSMDIQFTALRMAAKVFTKMALENGSLPSPLANRLTESGLEVGYLDEGGSFIAGLRPNSDTKVASITTSDSSTQNNSSPLAVTSSEEDNSLVLRFKDEIITSAEWFAEFENNPEVYKAFDDAMYGRAAGHYDEAAEIFYSNINASRNVFANYTSSSETDFRKILGEYYTNNPISAYEVEPTPDQVGVAPTSGEAKKDAIDAYFEELYENTLVDPDDPGDWGTPDRIYDKAQAATLSYLVNNALNANETYESMKYFLTLEEIMSKTKAGDGNSAPINEMLNYLSASGENGRSAIQSPTLSSILTKSFTSYYADDESKNEIKPYSIDRIHQILEKYSSTITDNGLKYALAIAGISTTSNSSSSYGAQDDERTILKLLPKETEPTPPTCNRYATSEDAGYDPTCEAQWVQYEKDLADWLEYLEKRDEKNHPTTMALISELKTALSSDSSKTTFLSDKGFNDVIGTDAGELFSKGGSILGSKIATTAQGGTSSTADSVIAYQKETDHVLALQAAADRVDRSPFDITSQNTFLGSIVHNFSNYLYTTPSFSSSFSSFSSILRNSFASILPNAFADNESSFQTTFGECPENDIYGDGFVCSAFSYPTVSFDLDYIQSYIESRPSSEPTDANDFIEYNNNRTSNVGYYNTKIADSAGTIKPTFGGKIRQFFTFIGNKIAQIVDSDARFRDYYSTKYISYSEEQLAIIAGTAFTDGGKGEYKEAQAYCVLSRLLDQAGYFSKENTNKTAFSDAFVPGIGESPYIATLKATSPDFSSMSDAEYLAAISGMSEKEANIVLGYVAYESYLASIDYKNRLAFGREEIFDFENSIQFEETDPFEAELAVIAKNDHLKITRKDPTYAA